MAKVWDRRPPVGDLATILLFKDLAAGRERGDAIKAWRVADARCRGNLNGSLSGDLDFGVDDVFRPVSPTSGNVAWQGEIRKRGHSDVVRSSDAGFKHATAPYRYGPCLANIVNSAGRRMPSDSTQFNIDDPAGANFDSSPGLIGIVYALIETDRRLDLSLERHMRKNVIPTQRLFDHHQVKRIKRFQQSDIRQCVCRVRVRH